MLSWRGPRTEHNLSFPLPITHGTPIPGLKSAGSDLPHAVVLVGSDSFPLAAQRSLLAVLAGREWWMVAGCPSLRCGPLLLWRQGVAGTGTQQMLGVVGQRPGRFVGYVLGLG